MVYFCFLWLTKRALLCYSTNCTKSVNTLEVKQNTGKQNGNKADLGERRNGVITLDYADRRPIYEQVVEKMKELILLGVLETDSQLPSVRELAMELSINPNTVQRAYAELERQGVIYCVKGRGNFVSGASALREQHKQEIVAQISELVNRAIKAEITEEEFRSFVKEFYKQG